MDRKDMLLRLQDSWEKLGTPYEYVAEELFLDEDQCEPGISFTGPEGHIASIAYYGGPTEDSDDASPCLRLLREVFGEDWGVQQWIVDINPTRVRWQCKHLGTVEQCPWSDDSRLHALVLAVEAKVKSDE